MSYFCAETDYETIEAVRDAYPGAAVVVEVEGGWKVFEFVTDYETWEAQS